MMIARGPQRRRRRLSAHLLVVAVIAALVFSVLPFAGGASAQEQDFPVLDPELVIPLNDALDNTGDDPAPTETSTEIPTLFIPDEVIDFEPELEPTAEPTMESTTEPTAEPFLFVPENDVIVQKFGCPDGYDALAATRDDLLLNCTEAPAVEFTLTDNHGVTSSLTTPGTGVNFVKFESAAFGAITLTESTPDGYSDPRVFCRLQSTYFQEVDLGEFAAPGGSISADINEKYDYFYCDWFNIHTPETSGDVQILKHGCPAGFDAVNATADELAATCQDLPIATFKLTDSTGATSEKTTDGSGNNSVTFEDVPFGALWLYEQPIDGYDGSRVICDGNGHRDSQPESFELTVQQNNAMVDFEYDHQHVACDWYNIPIDNDHDGSITIYKHTCPAGYDVNAYGSNPWLDCPDLTNGITFSLYQGGNFYSQEDTGDSIDGGVYWGSLESGDYQVQETMPADTDYAFVFGCMSDSYNSMAPTDLITLEFDNAFLIDLQPGEHLTCHWYNVPERHGGTIVITKYWCDGATYTTWACDLYEQGASFELSNQWTSFDVTTGWDGTVAVDVDAGSYSIDEIGGSWCHAEANYTDQDGNLVVYDNDVTSVTIYNCGPRETPKTPKTPKFPNTGVGPDAAALPFSA